MDKNKRLHNCPFPNHFHHKADAKHCLQLVEFTIAPEERLKLNRPWNAVDESKWRRLCFHIETKVKDMMWLLEGKDPKTERLAAPKQKGPRVKANYTGLAGRIKKYKRQIVDATFDQPPSNLVSVELIPRSELMNKKEGTPDGYRSIASMFGRKKRKVDIDSGVAAALAAEDPTLDKEKPGIEKDSVVPDKDEVTVVVSADADEEPMQTAVI